MQKSRALFRKSCREPRDCAFLYLFSSFRLVTLQVPLSSSFSLTPASHVQRFLASQTIPQMVRHFLWFACLSWLDHQRDHLTPLPRDPRLSHWFPYLSLDWIYFRHRREYSDTGAEGSAIIQSWTALGESHLCLLAHLPHLCSQLFSKVLSHLLPAHFKAPKAMAEGQSMLLRAHSIPWHPSGRWEEVWVPYSSCSQQWQSHNLDFAQHMFLHNQTDWHPSVSKFVPADVPNPHHFIIIVMISISAKMVVKTQFSWAKLTTKVFTARATWLLSCSRNWLQLWNKI